MPPWGHDGQVPAFRDGWHYYYPLWRWVDQTWEAGELPLWNPHENLGVPLASDPTVALWYPGRQLMRVVPDFPTAYRLFLGVHLVGAAWGAYRAACQLGGSRTAAVLAGLSYGYGGTVLFQYANPIYLVGAVWFAFGTAAIVRRLRFPPTRRTRWPSCELTVALAFSVLGGDPQTAVHLGLIAGLGIVCWAPTADGWRVCMRYVRDSLLALSGAAVLAFWIAGIQIVPTLQRLPATGRVESNRDASDAKWWGPLEPGTHAATAYEFSVGPWRWCEWAWPQAGGRMFPRNQRWMTALPAEGRIWSPSLYAGAVAVAFALMGLRGLRTSRTVRWLTLVFLFASTAACGHYGLGWVLHEASYWFTGESHGRSVGAHMGGVYWLMTKCVPGYEWFRYPAKWTTCASLALALLASVGWDAGRCPVPSESACVASTLPESRRRRILLSPVWMALIATCLAIAFVGEGVLRSGAFQSWCQRIPPDDWLGPFDVEGCVRQVRRGLWATFLLVALAGVIAEVRRRQATPENSPAASWCVWGPSVAVIVLLIGDLVYANHWLVSWVPAEPRASPAMSTKASWENLEARTTETVDFQNTEPVRGFRLSSRNGWPAAWRTSGSNDRLVETARWEYVTRFPKTNLFERESIVSLEDGWSAASYRELLAATLSWEKQEHRPAGLPPRAILRSLGVTHVIDPGNGQGKDEVSQPAIYAQSQPFPAVWVVPKCITYREEQVGDGGYDGGTILRPGGRMIDLRHMAVVSVPKQQYDKSQVDGRGEHAAERYAWREDRLNVVTPGVARCGVVSRELRRLVVQVESTTVGFLVARDGYDPGWKASWQPEGSNFSRVLPTWRVNGVMRGVWIPAGRGQLVWKYAPGSLEFGAWMSVVGVLAWGLCLTRKLTWGAWGPRVWGGGERPTRTNCERGEA